MAGPVTWGGGVNRWDWSGGGSARPTAGFSAPAQDDPRVAEYQRLLAKDVPADVASELAFFSKDGGKPVEYFLQRGLSPADAQRASQASALVGAGIPASYFDNLLGRAGAGGTAAARPQTEVDPRTGELILIDATGNVRRTGQQVGFAGVDPRAQYEDEARRAANAEAMGLAGQGDAAAQWRAVLGERAAMDRAGFREKGAMDRASLAENARQADTGAALDEFRTRANLLPQFGQIALQASDQQRDILKTGGDYLARAFGQANQESPLGQVTQADLSNTLMRNLAGLDKLIPEARVTGRRGFAGVPGFEDAPAFAAPGAYIPPTMRGFAGLGAAPAIGGTPMVSASQTGGEGTGGAGTAAAVPARQQWTDSSEGAPRGPYDAPVPAPTSTPTGRGFSAWPSDEEAMGAPRIGGDRAATTAGGTRWGPTALAAGDALSNLFGWASRTGGAMRGLYGPRGFAHGTGKDYTTEPAFVINEKGPELVENLDGGRIRIHDAETTKKMGFTTPGYDEGTSGGEMSRKQRNTFRTRLEMQDLMSKDLDPTQFFGMGGVQPVRGLWGAAPEGVSAATQITDAASRRISPELLRAAGVGTGAAKPNIAKLLTRLYGALDDATRKVPRFETGTYGSSANPTAAMYGNPDTGSEDYIRQFFLQNGKDKLGRTMLSPQLPMGESMMGDVTAEDGSMQQGWTANPLTPEGGWNTWAQGNTRLPGAKPGFFSGMDKPMSQEELQAMALRYAPPRIRSVFEGQNPGAPYVGAGLGAGFRAPTARMLSQLNEDDLGALSTLTNVRSSGKTTLADLTRQAGYMASPVGGGSGRAAKVRGLGI